MAYPANKERNRQLVALRNQNPEKYTFEKLGEIFRIKKETAFNIYKREVSKKELVLAR